MQRYGMTIPIGGDPLHAQERWIRELVDLGYTDLWSAEADTWDAFTPLALASVWAPTLRLGCAVCPVYTRGPALLAMSAASLAQAAPGRFVLGIGASSPAIVQDWNGIPWEEPWKRTRDVLRFLRQAFSGEKVSGPFETLRAKNFRLRVAPPEPPPILVAALREGMLRLAGREGDGAILNYLSADDVARVAPIVKQFGAHREIVARIFVCPNPDTEAVRAAGRFALTAYLNTPVYSAYHDWLGRSELLGEMWKRWRAGDRKGAVAAVPDQVVDDLIVHGPPEKCREEIQRYVANGVDTPMLMPLPIGIDPATAIRVLAPR
jgi:probable F420-dependent oxidoreductase